MSTSPKPRILAARIFHETNTFVETPTILADFKIRRGTELFQCRKDGSTLGALLDFAEENNWEVLPTVDFSTSPSGLVEAEVLETFWKIFEEEVNRLERPPDAFHLILHGAMACDGDRKFQDAEGEILCRIRSLPALANIPLFGVLDLHANVTETMIQHSDCLVAYRENPHIDAAETSVRAARLLARCLESGERPKQFLKQCPVLWPAPGTGTAVSPVHDLEVIARKAEAENPTVWAVNVVPGFAHADIHDAGVSFSVAGTDEKIAQKILDELSEKTMASKQQGLPFEWKLDDAIDDALAKGKFPVCLVETADNIGGGTPGDGTAILRTLLSKNAGPSVSAIADAQAVEALNHKKIGDEVSVEIGGKGFSLDPGPVRLEGKLIHRSDGKFELEDHQSHMASIHGIHIDMGASVVIQSGEVTVLINSKKTAPMDLGQLHSQGIRPAEMNFINIKAAVAYLRAYEKIAKAHYYVETPGPCATNLKNLPYKNVRRPIFPLD
ncbi:MAG: M81 family metallopeptidase [Chthoniobacterales bacterium]